MNNNSYMAKSMYSGIGGFGGGSAMRSRPPAPGCGPPPSGSAMSFGGLKIGGSAM